jgi:hypothetical protein
VYTSSVLRGAPYAFYKISFTYQKKVIINVNNFASIIGFTTKAKQHQNENQKQSHMYLFTPKAQGS